MPYIGNVTVDFNVGTDNINNDAVTSEKIADGTIVNVDVNPSAAIAGTKINPDFGSQTVQTTGVFSHALGLASAPTITFTGDPNTGLYSPGDDQLAISTGGTGRLFVEADGKVGIGITSPGYLIDGSNSSAPTLRLTDGIRHLLVRGGSTTQNPGIGTNYAGDLSFFTNGTANERARIDSSGRLLVGTSTTSSISNTVFQGSSGSTDIAIIRLATNAATPADGAGIGQILFAESSSLHSGCAGITALRDGGTWSASSRPSRLVFSTTADGVTSPAERLHITSNGTLRLFNSPGIDFSQIQTSSAGMTSEILDSYEEGTFTPTIIGSTNAGTGTYSTQIGRYTKIGRNVSFTIRLTWSAHTGTGNMRIGGLPFTAGGTLYVLPAWTNNITLGTNGVFCPYVQSTTTLIYTASYPAGGGAASEIAVDTSGGIILSGVYEAA